MEMRGEREGRRRTSAARRRRPEDVLLGATLFAPAAPCMRPATLAVILGLVASDKSVETETRTSAHPMARAQWMTLRRSPPSPTCPAHDTPLTPDPHPPHRLPRHDKPLLPKFRRVPRTPVRRRQHTTRTCPSTRIDRRQLQVPPGNLQHPIRGNLLPRPTSTTSERPVGSVVGERR